MDTFSSVSLVTTLVVTVMCLRIMIHLDIVLLKSVMTHATHLLGYLLQVYHDFVSEIHSASGTGDEVFFDFVHGGNSQTYVHHKGNPTQVYWLWRKCIRSHTPSIMGIQQLLDSTVYSSSSIEIYEKIIGDGFTTPGGLKAAKVCHVNSVFHAILKLTAKLRGNLT